MAWQTQDTIFTVSLGVLTIVVSVLRYDLDKLTNKVKKLKDTLNL